MTNMAKSLRSYKNRRKQEVIDRKNTEDDRPESANADENREYVFKVCLSGVSGIGKTSIFNRLRGKPFQEQPIVVAETDRYDYKTTVKKKDKNVGVTLQVWDTAGQEREHSLTLGYYRNAHLVVLIFDLGVKETMYDMETIAKDVIENGNCVDVKFCFAGNKTDLPNWETTRDEVNAYLSNNETIGCVGEKIHFTSAMHDDGIKELFETVAEKLIGTNIAPVDPRVTSLEFKRRTVGKESKCC